MRKLFLALFVLCSFFASAQKIQKVNTYGYEYNRFISDTLFALPGDTFAVPAAYQGYPFLARKATTLYVWNTSTFIWQALAGGTTFQQSLIASSDLTQANYINSKNNSLTFDSIGTGIKLLAYGTNVKHQIKAINPGVDSTVFSVERGTPSANKNITALVATSTITNKLEVTGSRTAAQSLKADGNSLITLVGKVLKLSTSDTSAPTNITYFQQTPDSISIHRSGIKGAFFRVRDMIPKNTSAGLTTLRYDSTDGQFYYTDNAPAASTENIYNIDGFLTGQRRLGGAGFMLTLDSTQLRVRDTAETVTGGKYGSINDQTKNGNDFLVYDSVYSVNVTQNTLNGLQIKVRDFNDLDTNVSFTVNPNGVTYAGTLHNQATVTTASTSITTLKTISTVSDSKGTLLVNMVALESGNGLSGKKYVHWRNDGGTVTILQIVDEEADYLDGWTTATWTVDASGTNLRIRVTADQANDTLWDATYSLKYIQWYP